MACRLFKFQHACSVVLAHGPSCSTSCRISLPKPRVKPESSLMEGRFLTTGPPGISLGCFLRSCSVPGPTPAAQSSKQKSRGNLKCTQEISVHNDKQR